MHHHIPRLLKVLSVVSLLTFGLSALALGELLGDLVDTTEEVLQVDEIESDGELAVEVDENLLELDGEDKTVSVENSLLESTTDSAGLDEVGDTAYMIQEDMLHGSIKKITGKKIDHYYVWVCTGDVCVPVDPFTFNN